MGLDLVRLSSGKFLEANLGLRSKGFEHEVPSITKE